jgi:hypothetical protein
MVAWKQEWSHGRWLLPPPSPRTLPTPSHLPAPRRWPNHHQRSSPHQPHVGAYSKPGDHPKSVGGLPSPPSQHCWTQQGPEVARRYTFFPSFIGCELTNIFFLEKRRRNTPHFIKKEGKRGRKGPEYRTSLWRPKTSIQETIHTQLKDTTYLRHWYWERLKMKDPSPATIHFSLSSAVASKIIVILGGGTRQTPLCF